MSQDFIRCAAALKRVLSEERINTIASEAAFFERLRKFTPARAIWTFVTAMGSGTAKSLVGILRLFTDLTGESMRYKPFHDRLSVPGFPEFLRQSLAFFMSQLSEPIRRDLRKPSRKMIDESLVDFKRAPVLHDDILESSKVPRSAHTASTTGSLSAWLWHLTVRQSELFFLNPKSSPGSSFSATRGTRVTSTHPE